MNFGNKKKPLWLVLLFFLSTGGGIAVFFIWKSLPTLANPPDLRLYSAIRNAKTAFELAQESMPEENAAKKPDPFKQPEAYFKDDSKSASSGHGSPSEYQASGKAPSSRMGAKLTTRFKRPPLKGRLRRGIRSGKGSSTSGRPVSSFGKTAGDEATVSKDLSSEEKDSPLRGAMASLKRTSEHVGAGAVLSSGDKAKYHADLGYAEALAGQKGMSYGKDLAKLDTIKTEVKDLKMQTPRTLTAPEPGAPTRDENAEAKDPVLNKIKDAMKKASNPIAAPISTALAPLVGAAGSPPPSRSRATPEDLSFRGQDSGSGPRGVDMGDLGGQFGKECYLEDVAANMSPEDIAADLKTMDYHIFETDNGRTWLYDGVTYEVVPLD